MNMNIHSKENNTHVDHTIKDITQDDMEWEPSDITNDMILGDPIIDNHKKMLEQMDNFGKIYDEYYSLKDLTDKDKLSLKDKSIHILQNIRSTSMKFIDTIVIKNPIDKIFKK